MRLIPAAVKRNAILWLGQGISPRRLALTLALGFAVGCIPVVGIPTVLCAGLALALQTESPSYSGRELRRHAPAICVDHSFCPARRPHHCVDGFRPFCAVPGSSHAGALFRSQFRHPHERNGGPGVARVADGCRSRCPFDDPGAEPDVAPHTDPEKRPGRRLTASRPTFIVVSVCQAASTGNTKASPES